MRDFDTHWESVVGVLVLFCSDYADVLASLSTFKAIKIIKRSILVKNLYSRCLADARCPIFLAGERLLKNQFIQFLKI